MQLGYHTGYWSAGVPDGVADAVARCDDLGFDSVWTAEAYGSDCLTPLAWWGANTTTLRPSGVSSASDASCAASASSAIGTSGAGIN